MANNITIIKIETTKAAKGYDVVEVAYKAQDGKVKAMRVMAFAQPAIVEQLKQFKAGDVVTAEFEQNAKGYWQFKSLTSTGETKDVTAPEPTKAGRNGGNWETPEERAARQVLIVRQSSIGHALSYFELTKAKPSFAELVSYAEAIKNYVFNGQGAGTGGAEIE